MEKRNQAATKSLEKPIARDKQEVYQEAKQKLKGLIGLDNVKSEIDELMSFTWIQNLAFLYDIESAEKSCNHIAFVGNPGTGKTEVARIISGLYYGLEIIESEYFIETNRSQLIGPYIGHSEIRTAAVLQDVIDHGGTLFIDEFHQLVIGDKEDNDYGKQILNTIVSYMENYRNKFVLIVAGYPEQMRKAISNDPGLKSRFGGIINFPDYSEAQLFEIFNSFAEKEGHNLDEQSSEYLKSILSNFLRKDNARGMRKFYEKTIRINSIRLFNKFSGKEYEDVDEKAFTSSYGTLTIDDLKKAYAKYKKEEEFYNDGITGNKIGFIKSL